MPLEELSKSKSISQLDQPYLRFPVTVILQMALVNLLASWGIHPAAATGHSSGEIAAAYTAGALSFQEAIAVAYFRGRITSDAIDSGVLSGAMASLGIGYEAALEVLKGTESGDTITIACINSPSNVTVSGSVSSLDQLEVVAAEKNIFFRKLRVPAAYHSPHMELLASDYKAALEQCLAEQASERPRIQFASPVTGELVHSTAELRRPSHWVTNMTHPVLFSSAMTALLSHPETTHSLQSFIEVGPHGALQGIIRQILRQGATEQERKELEVNIDSCLVRGINSVQASMEMAGRLFCQGYSVDFNAINFPKLPLQQRETMESSLLPRVVGNLPHYEWNHSVEYWAESSIMTDTLHRKYGPHDLLGVVMPAINPSQTIWRNMMRLTDIPWLLDHTVQSQVLLPGVAFGIAAIEACRQLDFATEETNKTSQGLYVLEDVDMSTAIVVPSHEHGIEMQLMMAEDEREHDDNQRKFTIFSRSREGAWTKHGTGKVAISTSVPEKLESHPQSDMDLTDVDPKYFYSRFAQCGPTLGKSFQNISNLKTTGTGRAVASITVPDNVPLAAYHGAEDAWFHPSVLDSCFQVAWAAVPDAVLEKMGVCVLRYMSNVFIDRTGALPHLSLLDVDVTITNMGRMGFEFSLTVCSSATGRVALRAESVKIQSLSPTSPSEADTMFDNYLILQPVWRPDVECLRDEDCAEALNLRPLQLTSPLLSNHMHQQGKIAVPYDMQHHTLMKEHYENLLDQYNLRTALQGLAALYAHKFPHCKVLEIGAGFGATSAAIIAGLQQGSPSCANTIQYTFTDVLSDFFPFAQERFHQFGSAMAFQSLDVNNDPLKQGFNVEEFDLVVVGNVFSSILDPRRALKHIRKVMKPSGMLLMMESTSRGPERPVPEDTSEWATLTRNGANFTLLQEAGFHVQLREANGSNAPYSVILAQAPVSRGPDRFRTETALVQLPGSTPLPASYVKELINSLTEATGTVVSQDILGSDELSGKVVILLTTNRDDFLWNMNQDNLSALQRTLQACSHLLWVTNCKTREEDVLDQPGPTSLVQGLLRTLRLEERLKSLISLDLDMQDWDNASIDSICSVFSSSFFSTGSKPKEYELWQRGRQRLIHRMAASTKLNEELSGLRGLPVPREEGFRTACRLEMKLQADGNSSHWEEAIGDKLEPSFIEVTPQVFPANAWDLPDEMLLKDNNRALPFVGVVSQVGSQVPDSCNVGDRVLGLAPGKTWTNRIQLCWTSAIVLPPDLLSHANAKQQSLMAIDMAAAGCLLEDVCGVIGNNKSIMINGADSALGQAILGMSLHIATAKRVIALVASATQREKVLLRYPELMDQVIVFNDSNSSNLHNQLQDGPLPDVIVDCSVYSTAAGIVPTELLLSPFGSFVRMTSLESRDLAAFCSLSLSFSHTTVDVGTFAAAKQESILRRTREMLRLMQSGVMLPYISTPIQSFALPSLRNVFEASRRGDHSNRQMIQVSDDDTIKVYSQSAVSKRTLANYLPGTTVYF